MLGLFIGAVCYAPNGAGLWDDDKNNHFVTLEPCPAFIDHMRDYGFREFRQFLPCIYKDSRLKRTDPWWEFKMAVDEFNLNRLRTIVPSNHICLDELMSAWRPRKTKTGGLPHLTSLPRKPEPLGTEYKCVTCNRTNMMLHLEVQRSAEGMKSTKYHHELGATAACTTRMAEEW